jgi:hypothetical protein
MTTIFAVLPFLEALLSFSIPNSGVIGGLLAIGLLANSILLMTAQKDYNKLKQEGIEIDAIKNALHNKASASIPFAVMSSIGYIAIIFGTTMVADAVFGLPY